MQLSPLNCHQGKPKSAGQRTDWMVPAQGGNSCSAHLHANKTSDFLVCLGTFGVWFDALLRIFWFLVILRGDFLFVFKPKNLHYSTKLVRVASSGSSFGNPRDHIAVCEVQAEHICNLSRCFWFILHIPRWWWASQDSTNFAYGHEVASSAHGNQEPDTIPTQPRSENSKMERKAMPPFHASRGTLPSK